MSSTSTGGGIDPGDVVGIIFGTIIVVFVLVAVTSACNRNNASAQQPNGGPQTGERDGNMVVLDGGQVAEAVVEIQPGCCCGGGDGDGDGGDGGGCGGCGGD